MKKIDKLLIRAFIGPFILTTAVVVFIFLMRFLMMYFDDFVGKDLGILVFVKLFFYFSIITLPTALPLAILLAALMCYGNLGEHTELTALKSAGIPLSRLIFPTMIFAFFIAICSFLYNNYVNPWANLKGYSLLYDVKSTKLTLNLQEGVFYNEIPGYRLKVREKSQDGKSLKGVIVYDHTSGRGNKNLTLADSGKMYTVNNGSLLVFELFNGKNYLEYTNNFNQFNETQFVKNTFQKNKIVFSLESFGIKRTEEERFLYHDYMKNISQLNTKIDSMKVVINQTKVEHLQLFKSQHAYQFSKLSYAAVGKESRSISGGTWIQKKLDKLKSDARNDQVKGMVVAELNNRWLALKANEEVLRSKQKEMNKSGIEYWKKITMAASCFVMFLIGSSLGAIIKKGGFGLPVLLSVSFFIFMYVLMQLGEKNAKEGVIPVVSGVWMPNLVLLAIALLLLKKASDDVRLFDYDAYTVVWDNLKSKYWRKKSN